MTDASRKIVWKWETEAYGKNVPTTDPDSDGVQNKLDLRFAGQIADAETGFFYNINRYYDPVTGRYMQSDPIGLRGGLNTYGYVRGNPINRIDPLGLFDSQAACDAESQREQWEEDADKARAEGDWDEYYSDLNSAYERMRDYYNAMDTPIPDEPLPPGPRPRPSLDIPDGPQVDIPLPKL